MLNLEGTSEETQAGLRLWSDLGTNLVLPEDIGDIMSYSLGTSWVLNDSHSSAPVNLTDLWTCWGFLGSAGRAALFEESETPE